MSYFIEHRPDKIKSKVLNLIFIIAEAYYCTKFGNVKGVLSLTEHLIMFDPIRCFENEMIM